MAEHECKKEHEWGELEATLESLILIAKDTNNTLKGNGKPGLCTEVALIKQRQGLIWAGLSALALTVLGLVASVVKALIVGG